MSSIRNLFTAVILSCIIVPNASGQANAVFNKPHRPQIHFSPGKHWMNDPNGMVYFNGVYHLFFQHSPFTTVPDFAKMHWGHAISRDLIHWQELEPAIGPDEYGAIFSGGAVADVNNTSGFARNGETPLVAIYTQHDMNGEKSGRNDFQNQSIAYSLDEGKTWIKYQGNPVLKNPGIKDFRDPKVCWNEVTNNWIMTLATLDRITFYSSPDLKSWTKESEFGKDAGAHGGVWECPDLISFDHNGKKIWVLIVNLNPGGPNGGSATQYFIGDFDGHTFKPYDTDTRWLDYGPDEYAGVTFSNTGNRKIFLGWMTNWQYAQVVPTESWRGAATIPRELSIREVNGKYLLVSTPVKELNRLIANSSKFQNISVRHFDLTAKTGKISGPVQMKLSSDMVKDFSITLSNSLNQKLIIGFDQSNKQFFIDRTGSGKVDFEKGFAGRHTSPRFVHSKNIDLTLIIDKASVELFADGGLTIMTETFFPGEDFTNISIQSKEKFNIKRLELQKLQSIHSPVGWHPTGE